MTRINLRRRLRRASVPTVLATVAVGVVAAAPSHAAWTTLESGGQSVMLACKTPEEGGYGPVWKVTLVLANSHQDVVGHADVDVRRGRSLVSRTWLRTWAPGQWDVKTTYASRLFNDRLVGTAGWGDGQGHGRGGRFDVPVSTVFWC